MTQKNIFIEHPHAFFPFIFFNTAGKKVHSIVSIMKKTGRWQLLEEKYGELK